MENNSSLEVAIFQRKYSRIIDSDIVKEFIANFVSSKSHVPFSWADIQQYLKDKWSILVPPAAIRRWLKNELCYSFKRSAPIFINLNIEKQSYSKSLFSAKIVKEIDYYDVFINVDESTLNKKNIIENYSWTPIGVPTPIKSIIFAKSVSVIAAFSTEGLSFWCIWSGTNDSAIFVDYLKDLFKYLITHSKFKLARMCVILDNAKYHTSAFLNGLSKQNWG